MNTGRILTDPNWKRWLTWIGRAISLWPVYVLTSSAIWKLTREPWYVAEWERIGYEEAALTAIGLIQVTCLVLYVIPQTSVLGTVLLTGYLGGASASYVRMGEPSPVLIPLSTSLTAWLGIYLREPRLWSILPVRLRRT
jgi:hypothetical protein